LLPLPSFKLGLFECGIAQKVRVMAVKIELTKFAIFFFKIGLLQQKNFTFQKITKSSACRQYHRNLLSLRHCCPGKNKLDCLSQDSIFSTVKGEPNTARHSCRTHKHRTRTKILARDRQTTWINRTVNVKVKK